MEGTRDNKKSLIIFCSIIGVIILVLVIGIVVLGKNSTNPFLKAYDTVTSLIDEGFKESKDITGENAKIGMQGKISAEVDLNENLLNEDTKKIQDIVNDTEIVYEVKLDVEEKFIQLMLSALKANEELLNADMVINEDKAYIKIKDVLEEYFETDLDEELEFDVYTEPLEIIDDVEVLYNIAKKEARKQLNNKKNISTVSDKLKVDDKEISVKKHTLVLNNEMLYKTGLAILEDIKEDKNALEALTNIVNMDSYSEYDIEAIEGKIDESIEDLKDQLDNIAEDNDEEVANPAIIIYTKGRKNEIVKIELGTLTDKKIETEAVINVLQKEDNKVEYILEVEEKEICKVNVQEKGKDEYSVEVEIEDVKLSIEGIIAKNKIDVKYEIEAEGKTIEGQIFIQRDKNNIITKYSIESEEFGKIGLNMEFNILEEFDIPDVSKATKEIDEDEIQEKLMIKLKDVINKLGLDFDSLMGVPNVVEEIEEELPQGEFEFETNYEDFGYDMYYNDFEY